MTDREQKRRAAVDREIAKSADKIGSQEARQIHALLKGRNPKGKPAD